MSYVVVRFPERREVFIDDQSRGNNVDAAGMLRVLVCREGSRTFRLGGASDYMPPEQTLDVRDASLLNPFIVVFEKKVGPTKGQPKTRSRKPFPPARHGAENSTPRGFSQS